MKRILGLFLIVSLFSCEKLQETNLPLIKGKINFSQAELEQGIQIYTSNENFNKIKRKREEAVLRQHLLKEKSDFVKGKLLCAGKEVKVKFRLKGEEIDHLLGEFWSLRIQSKSYFLEQNKFSVQSLKSKDFLFEWIFHRWSKEVGLVHLEYFFVPFSVNDTLKGMYAFEGGFDSAILRKANRPNGPILKFDENILWRKKEFLNHPNRDSILMANAKIVQCNNSWEKKSEAPNLITEEAIHKLDLFRKNAIEPSKVFDYDLWAKYYALGELLGSNHHLRWINLRLYYNPKTHLFEPVAFDCFSKGEHGGRTTQIWFLNELHEPWVTVILADKNFKNKVQAEIVKLSTHENMKTFFHQNHGEITRNLKRIHIQNPEYHFSCEPFLKRGAFLQKALN